MTVGTCRQRKDNAETQSALRFRSGKNQRGGSNEKEYRSPKIVGKREESPGKSGARPLYQKQVVIPDVYNVLDPTQVKPGTSITPIP
jgi:hypothetical protein